MKLKFSLLFLLISLFSIAQDEEIHSIYFEFDKYDLKQEQVDAVINFVKKLDTTKVETIEIFGYCDDRGKDAYNYKLSTNRATTVKNKLVEKGIKNKIIITIEGKGRILIDEDVLDNVPEVRSKNRRVDVVVNYKAVVVSHLGIPQLYEQLPKNPIVGDRIYLDDVLFERGSSNLTFKAKKQLEFIAKQLNKFPNLEFEIQGHVCCTPYHTEAFDRETKKRELSKNRAERVYKYFYYRKVAKERMKTKACGNTQPLGKGSQFDRRVELVITKI
ncbi:MAG: OmpA family protein [Flavobacterium haoranii]